jgi:hypothetical protein
MTDSQWLAEQLEAGRVSQPVGTAVLRLMEVWSTMTHTDKTAQETIDVFAKLAMGHALVDPEPTPVGQWVDVHPGFVRVADVVRVKADVYSGDLGIMHNGRVGKVVAIRSGDVIVNTTDGRSPKLEGAHYSPFSLEKFVAR